MKNISIDMQENALFYDKVPNKPNYEYNVRFYISFEGLIQGNIIVINI